MTGEQAAAAPYARAVGVRGGRPSVTSLVVFRTEAAARSVA
ncbi:hypothetical protein [Streptomyces sp. NBC_00316]|nr:hypothetical protein [Streptomyces sp. NBC_00316]